MFEEFDFEYDFFTGQNTHTLLITVIDYEEASYGSIDEPPCGAQVWYNIFILRGYKERNIINQYKQSKLVSNEMIKAIENEVDIIALRYTEEIVNQENFYHKTFMEV